MADSPLLRRLGGSTRPAPRSAYWFDCGIRATYPDDLVSPPRWDILVLRCGCNATIHRDGITQHLFVLPGCPDWHPFSYILQFDTPTLTERGR